MKAENLKFSSHPHLPYRPTPFILDTDMDMDVDDVGALAVAHALADRGEIEILGVVCDSPSPHAHACARVVNAARGRAEIPVGTIHSGRLEKLLRYDHYRSWIPKRGNAFYNEAIAAMEPADSAHAVWPSTPLYRKLLAGAEDGSVVICCIGFLTALSELLKSVPDEYSPLGGVDLVRQKVRKLITMAEAAYPSGVDCCNWKIDLESAAHVLDAWPAPVVVTPLGRNVWTGASLRTALPEQDPVRRAYELYFRGECRSQQSWDLIAVLYGARDCGDLFELQQGNRCYLNPLDGLHVWRAPDVGQGDHGYLRQIVEDAVLEERIDELLCQYAVRAAMQAVPE